MLKLILGILGSLIIATPVMGLTSIRGTEYKEDYNKHGVKLTSGEKVIYLGKDCDVKSNLYGTGKWVQYRKGLLITFDSGILIGFTEQEVDISGNCIYW